MMLTDQAAQALAIDTETLRALEEGCGRVRPGALTVLTRLYRCGDASALQQLLAERPDFHGIARDAAPGHARRIAACTSSASLVRWQSTTTLPAPLQTRDYARAIGEPSATRPGARRPVTATTVFVLDPRVIQRGGDTARLMAEQLDHLLHLLEGGTDIRVLPESHGFLQPPGHLVEITLPGGPVLARPGPSWVDYCATDRLSSAIDDALRATDPDSSRDALHRAAAAHHARTRAHSPAVPEQDTPLEPLVPADAPGPDHGEPSNTARHQPQPRPAQPARPPRARADTIRLEQPTRPPGEEQR
ncbi:Scr1 family TA system antitoxin-like transcriptional regulator [Streptomyces sp. NBRC 110465]|uniref:Scr1 family TA system antitoxin-like transcriptional regulator n=1 Tax=Streptomyces sp. NBRC 110465 TaxID=1897621 RepID=UPI00093544BA|nr:Scr1 family TA system antitoxin-like transcriptional regulator [Streptomyces sp. NBRC 110465]